MEVGTELCVVGSEDGEAAPATSAAREEARSEEREPSPPSPPSPVDGPVDSPPAASPAGRRGRTKRLSPVVRRLVRQHGVDVDRIEGTGQGGRVTRRDVEAYLGTVPDRAPRRPPQLRRRRSRRLPLRLRRPGLPRRSRRSHRWRPRLPQSRT